MLVRRTLQVAVAAVAASAVFAVLWNIALGVNEPGLGQIVASYLQWGRWAEWATVVVLASMLIVAPLLPDSRRGGHVVVAGAVIGIVGKLINLSTLPGVDVVDRFGVSAIPTDLVAGRAFQFSAGVDPTYVWAGGMLLIGVGMFLLSADFGDQTWSRASWMLGAALAVVALTDMNVEMATVSWLASWIATGILIHWLLVALRVTRLQQQARSAAPVGTVERLSGEG